MHGMMCSMGKGELPLWGMDLGIERCVPLADEMSAYE